MKSIGFAIGLAILSLGMSLAPEVEAEGCTVYWIKDHSDWESADHIVEIVPGEQFERNAGLIKDCKVVNYSSPVTYRLWMKAVAWSDYKADIAIIAEHYPRPYDE
jgi:hypothetical protein